MIVGLASFQKKVIEDINDYEAYLEADLEACIDEGEEDYAEQRHRQLEGLQKVRGQISELLYTLKPFQE